MRPCAIAGTRPALFILAALAAFTFDETARAQEPESDPTQKPEPQPEAGEDAAPSDVAPEAADEAGTPDEAPAREAGTPEEAPAPEPSPSPQPKPAAATPPPAPQGSEGPPPSTAVAAVETEAAPESTAEQSWYYRPPLRVAFGKGDRQVGLTFYGFLQADLIYDTTRSYSESMDDDLVARTDTYDGTVGRTQFSTRNTRLGLMFESPELGGVRPVAVVEGDFFGNQPGDPPDVSERDYYESATFRLRKAYVELQNRFVDVLVGQDYDVFGWQNRFFPCSGEFLGLPNQVFSRSTQLRLSRAFGASGPVGLEVAASAARPAQRDSATPDVSAGLLLAANKYRGISTSGNGFTRDQPLSLGVSGTVRQFKVDAFAPPPTQTSNEVTGWGMSIDAFVPVIAAKDANDRGNALTLTGSFVMGTGIGDLMNATGGATFPTLPNPALANPPPVYEGNIDAGIVSFDLMGVLHTIDWQGFKVGLEVHLPPSGRIFFAANYTQAYSENLRELFPQGGAEIELLTHVADKSQYVDANLFYDATPAVRFGVAGAYTTVEYLDGDQPENIRARFQAMYFF